MTENAVEPQTRPPETASREPDSRQMGWEQTNNHSGLVSDAALQHLGLSGQPFASELADGEWYSDDTTREQLVDIKEALISGDDLLLVSGETGAGKSVLLKQLSASGGSRIQCFSVRGSKRFSTFNLFSGLLEAFKLKPPAELQDTLKEVIPCLQALSERNMLGVIVLDDADRISDEELSMLLGSVQYLNGGEDPLLRILMAAEPEFETRIPELLPTSSDLPYASLSIEPFDIGRAANYLSYRLNKVGDLEEFPFSEQQMQVICESANGLPSILNVAAAAQINQLYQQAEAGGDQYELIERGPILQNRPLKFGLGILGTGLILASAYLFVKPMLSPTEGENYEIVSNKPIDTNNSSLGTSESESKTIALVEEPAIKILPNTTTNESETNVETAPEAAIEIAVATEDQNQEITVVAVETTETEPELTDVTSETQASTATPAPAAEVEPVASAAVAEPEPTTTTIQQPSPSQETQEDTPADTPADNQADNQEAAQTDDQAETTITTASVTETQPANQQTAAVTPETSTANNAADSGSELSGALLESANWVLVQDPELYTVQMSASRQRSSVESFLIRSKLAAPNSIFSFKRGDSTWYALVHGLYPTITDARNAIESMPATAKSNQPWIRAIAQIQNSVKNQ